MREASPFTPVSTFEDIEDAHASGESSKIPFNNADNGILSAEEEEDFKYITSQGYNQTLYRTLNAFQNFSFGFVGVQCLGGITTLSYGYGLVVGGPAVFIWSFLGSFFFNIFVAFSLAEISSAYPNAGSVYNWTANLVPRKYVPFLSYVSGWSNFIGNVASDALQAFAFSNYLNAVIVASVDVGSDGGSSYSGYSSQDTVAVAIAVLFLWSLLNGLRIDKVGWITSFAVVIQIGAIVIIALSLYICADNLQSGEFVFRSFNNYTGNNNKAYVIAVGIISGANSFSGYDGSAHLAEETTKAKRATPYGIIYTVIATGLCGAFYILAMLYTTPSIDAVLLGPTISPAVNLFLQVCGRQLGLGFAWITLVSSFCGGFGSVTITGRISYALMRDGGLPFSEYFSQVHPTFKSPIRVIMLVCVIDSLLQLLCLSTNGLTAFYSLLSVCTVGFLFSYIVPIAAKICFRSDIPLPLSLGSFSPYCGVISILWLSFIIVLSFFPIYFPITDENMNWLIVVVAGIVFLCGLNWIMNAKHSFMGPKVYSLLSHTPSDEIERKDGNVGRREDSGLLIGKFYPFHKGHEHLLRAALSSHCKEVHLIVCYKENEFPSGAQRVEWIKELYPSVFVYSFADSDTNDPSDSALWTRITQQVLGFSPSDVFTSESYGDQFCAYLSAKHHLVDISRVAVTVSGTLVRAQPLRQWDYLSAPLRRFYAARVVLVGSESTHKTTLAEDLAREFSTIWVEEVGREVTNKKAALLSKVSTDDAVSVPWASDDFIEIAEAQNALEYSKAGICNRILICDTDSLATSVWHERYIKQTRPEILGEIFASLRSSTDFHRRIYLITDPVNVTFVQDGVRDGENLRSWMHQRFIEVLSDQGVPYLILQDKSYEGRKVQAITYIKSTLEL